LRQPVEAPAALAARPEVVREAEEPMTFGDAALEKQPFAHLTTDAKTEKAACQVLIGHVVDGPSHVGTRNAAYRASPTTCGIHVNSTNIAVQGVRLRERKNRVGPTPGCRRGSVDG